MRRPIRFLALIALMLGAGAALAEQAYTVTSVSLRAGPDRDYPVVVSLPANVLVEVLGCVDDYQWCDVDTGYDRGWVFAGSLAVPYRNRRVPLSGYGATVGVPIVIFSVNRYWDDHYQQRSWYRDRDRWENRPPRFRPSDRPYPGRPDYGPPGRPDYRPDRPDRGDRADRGDRGDRGGRGDRGDRPGRSDNHPPDRPVIQPPATQPPVARPPEASRPPGGRPPPPVFGTGENPAGGPPGGGR